MRITHLALTLVVALLPFSANAGGFFSHKSSSYCGYWWSWNCPAEVDDTAALEKLGEKIFFDKRLSRNYTQSCASCHDPDTGFTDPDSHDPSSLSADRRSFGTRNSPTLSYIGHVPDFQMALALDPFQTLGKVLEAKPDLDVSALTVPEALGLLGEFATPSVQSFGGFFIDGRAASLEEQAKIPFFSDVEMGLHSPWQLVRRLRWGRYSWEFKKQFGYDVFRSTERTLDGVAKALAAFQRSEKFAPFTSKFDAVMTGESTFSESEARGFALFNGNAGCVVCHNSNSALDPVEREQLFSDFLYHNVGTPKNYTLLNNIGDWGFIDKGRIEISGNSREEGMFRTPSLRNIEKTAPYMHNGVFNTLHEVVNFYNTRDVAGVESELRTDFTTTAPIMGSLGLSDTEVDDIVNFLRTLSDH